MVGAKPIVFYDAHCSFCRTWRKRLERSLGSGEVVFVDASDKAMARQLGVEDVGQLDRRICLLEPDGRQAWGYDAVVKLLARTAAAPVAWALGLRPIRALGRRVYDQVAMRRACLGHSTCAR